MRRKPNARKPKADLPARGRAINFYVGPRTAHKLELVRWLWRSADNKLCPYGRVLERLLAERK